MLKQFQEKKREDYNKRFPVKSKLYDIQIWKGEAWQFIQTYHTDLLKEIRKVVEESLWQCPMHEEIQTDNSCNECNQCLEVNAILYPLINKLDKEIK